MKKFYYLRDKTNRPVVTICIEERNGVYARGIAVCSVSDNPCKSTGRVKAAGRVNKAFGNKRNVCGPMDADSMYKIDHALCTFTLPVWGTELIKEGLFWGEGGTFLGIYDAVLSKREQRIMKVAKGV